MPSFVWRQPPPAITGVIWKIKARWTMFLKKSTWKKFPATRRFKSLKPKPAPWNIKIKSFFPTTRLSKSSICPAGICMTGICRRKLFRFCRKPRLLSKTRKAETEVLLNLEERIHQRLIDQEEAVAMVASSLRRARAEIRDLKRPIVNLLFLGPTGVGKTELAKTVAAVYFGDEETMIRIDMSEYQEKPSINRLIGAPPGYGSEQGGQLTEAVRKNPF